MPSENTNILPRLPAPDPYTFIKGSRRYQSQVRTTKSIHQSINQSTNLQPTNQSVNQPPSQSMNDLMVILHYLQEKARNKRKKDFS